LLVLYFTPESEFSFLHAQISLLEMPHGQRKKMMAQTTNVMRDDSDKVKFISMRPWKYIISNLL